MSAEPLRKPSDDRAESRNEVYHRTRVTLADRRSVLAFVVNLSPGGFRARIEVEIADGEWLTFQLPVIGTVTARVRWSLGGRVGCQFEHPIEPHAYERLLAMVRV